MASAGRPVPGPLIEMCQRGVCEVVFIKYGIEPALLQFLQSSPGRSCLAESYPHIKYDGWIEVRQIHEME